MKSLTLFHCFLETEVVRPAVASVAASLRFFLAFSRLGLVLYLLRAEQSPPCPGT